MGTITYPGAVATSLAFVQGPTGTTAGGSLGTITVQVLDQFGNPLNSSAAVTLALSNNPGASTVGGGATTVNAVNGVATFSGLYLNRVGTGYQLVASVSGLDETTSAPFNITPGAAAGVLFEQQPNVTLAGQIINPAVTVGVVDGFGNLLPTATNSVTDPRWPTAPARRRSAALSPSRRSTASPPSPTCPSTTPAAATR